MAGQVGHSEINWVGRSMPVHNYIGRKIARVNTIWRTVRGATVQYQVILQSLIDWNV